MKIKTNRRRFLSGLVDPISLFVIGSLAALALAYGISAVVTPEKHSCPKDQAEMVKMSNGNWYCTKCLYSANYDN